MRRPELLIWILEDEESARLVYEDILDVRYSTRYFDTLESFREALQAGSSRPDLVIADLRLPDGNLLDHLRRGLLGGAAGYPFLVVSSLDELDFFRECFRSGALDFLPKPFTKNELIAKVEKSLQLIAPRPVSVGNVLLEPEKMRVRAGSSGERDEYVQLTAKEFQLLTVLLRNPGSPVTRTQLQQAIWGATAVGTKTLDVHLVHLRKKVAPLKLSVRYLPDAGYLLQIPTRWDE